MRDHCAQADELLRGTAVLAATPWPAGHRAAWVAMRHEDGWTLEQIARVLGVTRERVRQIELAERARVRDARWPAAAVSSEPKKRPGDVA